MNMYFIMLCIYLAFSVIANLITFAHESDNVDYNNVIFVTRPNRALFQFLSDLEIHFLELMLYLFRSLETCCTDRPC